jgi:hypothetical protein
MKSFIYICSVALLFIIVLAIFNSNKNKELFTNNPIDIFTNDKCCNQKNIEECNKYGQSGVCNYQQNNKSCLCQNAF